MKEKGLLIMVLSPSGGGKGSILREIFAGNPNIRYSVSATTRQPRPGEIDGQEYMFIDRPIFEKMIAEGEMLEFAEYCGNYYGTPKKQVDLWRNQGYDVILEIEVQGGEQVKQLVTDCISLFIVPPSMDILEKRLRRRGTESEEAINGRLKAARQELPYARRHDYVIVNDRLEDAIYDMNAIIRAEKLRAARQQRLIDEILS